MMENGHVRYDRLVSLGRHCQTAYQIRRFTGDETAFYFDWIRAPHHGLVQVLRDRFRGCFQKENLVLCEDAENVADVSTGLLYGHNFSRIPGTRTIGPETIGLEFAAQRAKLDFLIGRWERAIQSESILFVRHDTPSREQALELYQLLREQAGTNCVELLIVIPPGHELPLDTAGIHVEKGGDLPSGPTDWKGLDEVWDQIFARYWSRDKPKRSDQCSAPATAAVNPARRQSRPEHPVVLFQVPNHIGLGHMNRMACVALALREMDPSVRVLFAVEGSSHGLLESMNLPYIMLPHPDMVFKSGRWDPWTNQERKGVLAAIVASLLDTIRPEVVVYDCFPSRYFIEPVIDRKIRTVLCIRKTTGFEIYAEDPRVRRVLDSEALIMIPHEAPDFALPQPIAGRATYVGSIVKPLPVDPEPVQLRLSSPGQRIIVISGGGGGYPDTVDYFNLCLHAFERLKTGLANVDALLITGPLFSRWRELALTSGAYVIPFDPHFTATCATADLVISQGGYNSINELVALGTPTICIPAERGFDDQFERARTIAANYPCIDCFEGYTIEALSSLMKARLNSVQPRTRTREPDGAYRASLEILKLLGRP